MAPPAGTVLATAVEDSANTKAWEYVSPGMVATMTNRYVARLQPAATTSVVTSSHVMSRTEDPTLEMSAYWGGKYQKMTITTASDPSAETA